MALALIHAIYHSLHHLKAYPQHKRATRFISLQERNESKAELKGQDSWSHTIDDEAAEDGSLAVENVVKDRSAAADEIQLYKGGSYTRMMNAFRPVMVALIASSVEAFGEPIETCSFS